MLHVPKNSDGFSDEALRLDILLVWITVGKSVP